MSQPARAVWIEIISEFLDGVFDLSQPARAVWIEIRLMIVLYLSSPSQPARAVWIEIINCPLISNICEVTACEGCVD